MASKIFMDETKKILKNTSNNAAQYWKMLQASDEADNIYHFCMKLFETVTNNSKDQFLSDDHEAMFSTLMILQFYKNTKLKPERWLDQTQKIFQESKPRLYQHAKWIIKLYLKNTEQHQFALNFISSTVHMPEKLSWQIEPGQQLQENLKEASDYEDIIEFKRKDKPYKRLSNLAFDETLKESKIATFSYCCFLDYIRSNNYVIKKKIWVAILDNLKGLIHAMRYSGKGYPLVTVYLHLINQLLKFYGCHFDDLLRQFIYFVNILRSSPGVNGYLAQIVFETVHGELKCVGNAFRREVKRKYVNLDVKKVEALGSKKYLVTSRKANFKNPQFCTLTNLRKLFIYNILGSCKHPNMQHHWKTVELLDSDTTFELYYKLLKIVDIANTLQTYQSIQKLIRQSITELFKLPWKPYRKLHKQEQLELAEMINHENPLKYFQFPNFEILQLTLQDLADPKYRYSLNQLFEESKQYPYSQFFYRSNLEFIFFGNDQEMLGLLQTFCHYVVNLPPQEYQKFVFYIVPTVDGSCSLAKYLSIKDIWFRRHVYNVFRKKMIYPYVSPSNPDIKDTFPMYLYIKSLHMYLREAQFKVPFQIFQCDLSMLDSQNKTEVKTIYFVNKILMGTSIESSQARKESKKEKKQFDILEFYIQKSKKSYNMTVDINVRYKEPGTDSLVTKMEKNMQIEDIQICNTPRFYFFGYRPDPTNQFIEVSILTQTAGKIFTNEVQSKENFKRYSDAEMAQTFRDLFINMTVESMVIERSEAMKDMLKLLIDGVQFSNVDKIQISQAKTIKDLPMTFPVKCFLPFGDFKYDK